MASQVVFDRIVWYFHGGKKMGVCCGAILAQHVGQLGETGRLAFPWQSGINCFATMRE